MPHLSQNRKIALSALAIFMMSFAFMLFFLDEKIMDENTQGANVFEADGHGGNTNEPEEVQIEPKQEESKKWMETMYPKIKELEDGDSGRLMVDKLF